VVREETVVTAVVVCGALGLVLVAGGLWMLLDHRFAWLFHLKTLEPRAARRWTGGLYSTRGGGTRDLAYLLRSCERVVKLGLESPRRGMFGRSDRVHCAGTAEGRRAAFALAPAGVRFVADRCL
jgi:hypothetical protein